MTILVGIKCSNGIVVASDSAATFSAGAMPTSEHSVQKVKTLSGNSLIVAGTGSVGLGQRFESVVNDIWAANKLRGKNRIDGGVIISRAMLQNMSQTGFKADQFGALLAFPLDGDVHLCEFATTDFQPEFKEDIWYVSMGSGQLIVDPFLSLIRKVFWQDESPNLQDGIFAAVWAIQHAIETNAGGVDGPIQIATLERNRGANLLGADEIQEHLQNVEAACNHLSGYMDILNGNEPAAEAEMPRPAANADEEQAGE